jgi:MFS family permease
MLSMPDETYIHRARYSLYALGFLFSVYAALPAYISSSYLSKYISESLVGIVFAAGSILTILAFISMSSLLRRFGNYRTAIGLTVLTLISSLGLAFSTHPFVIFVAFITHFASLSLIGLNLDIFLEKTSKDSETGTVRGAYLTWANLAWVFAPSISAFILTRSSFAGIYITSVVVILPILVILALAFYRFKDPEYPAEPYFSHVSMLWKERNMKAVFMVSFLLQFFYAWMVIYTPIYLHETIGFSWDNIGIMFSIMLLPFVLLDEPLGWIADRYLGEKELLVAGFTVMGLSTVAIAFMTSDNIFLWGAVLFATRVGAATVEIMADTYFFKKIDASKIYLMSFYRTVRPIAYIIAPIAASLLFVTLDLKSLFVILGILMLYGIRHSLALEDTK